MNLDFDIQLSGGSKLVEDYVAGEPRIESFFTGRFDEVEAYLKKSQEVGARFDQRARAAAVRAIRAPTEAARRKLDRLVEEDGFFVTTGQQPGLFTGPLYSVYKALTALSLANVLEDLLERPVVALFWVASEDHDWEEASGTCLPSVGNELECIRIPIPPGMDNQPLHRVPLQTELEQAFSRLTELLPDTEFSAPYLELIGKAYPIGTTLPSGYEATLAGLLGRFGLCFTDAADPVLKELSKPILSEELTASEEKEKLLVDSTARLEALGYSAQVTIMGGGVNLFLEGSHGRERIYRTADGFQLRPSGEELGAEEILARLDADPGLFSPNVFLRPVVESHVFPVLSYVAGPGEVAYYAQLGDFFRGHGIEMPVIHPRHTVTVLEGKISKILKKYGMDPATLTRPIHELVGELARDELPAAVTDTLVALRSAVGAEAGRLQEAVADVDPTLKGTVSNTRNGLFRALDDLEKKILQSVKRKNEVALAQLEKARLHVAPEGRPQERIFNVFYYLARYGEDFLEELLRRFEVPVQATRAVSTE